MKKDLSKYEILQKNFKIWHKKLKNDIEVGKVIKPEETLPYVYNLCKYSPEFFFQKYVKIIAPDFERHPADWLKHSKETPFKLFDYQIELLKAYVNYDAVLGLLARQMGKTSLIYGIYVWEALFHTRNTALGIISRNSKQAEIVLFNIKQIFRKLPEWLQVDIGKDNNKEYELIFPLKSGQKEPDRTVIVVEGASQTPFSGYGNLARVYFDEAELVNTKEKGLDEKIISSIVPTGANIFATSSLKDSDTWFRRELLNSDSFYHKIVYDYKAHPYYAKDTKYTFRTASGDKHLSWAEWRKLIIGEERFVSEHGCNIEFTKDDKPFVEVNDEVHICSSELYLDKNETIYIAADQGFSEKSKFSIVFARINSQGTKKVAQFFDHVEFVPKTVREVFNKVNDVLIKYSINPNNVIFAIDGNDIKPKPSVDSTTNIVKDLKYLWQKAFLTELRLVYTRKYSQLESNELVNTALIGRYVQFAPKRLRTALKRITIDKNGKIKDNMFTNTVDSVRIWFMNFADKLNLEKKSSQGELDSLRDELLRNSDSISFNSGSLLL